uniref:CDK5 regulatory subunit associated protein 2 n=1 Tax=Macrostomum lignano TaxID=282301 RepID=A0A1I8F8R4_9PLAT
MLKKIQNLQKREGAPGPELRAGRREHLTNDLTRRLFRLKQSRLLEADEKLEAAEEKESPAVGLKQSRRCCCRRCHLQRGGPETSRAEVPLSSSTSDMQPHQTSLKSDLENLRQQLDQSQAEHQPQDEQAGAGGALPAVQENTRLKRAPSDGVGQAATG